MSAQRGTSDRVDVAAIPPVPSSPKRLLALLLVLGAAAGLALLIISDRLAREGRWGTVAISEGFDDTAWRERWSVLNGSFRMQDGRLVTTGPEQSTLMLRRRLPAGSAVEFTAIALPGHPVGDLSVVWTEADFEREERPNPWKFTKPTWMLQTGAYDNSFASITEVGRGRMALSHFRLERGRPHRIRVEVEPQALSLIVDGELICHHQVDVPLSGGHIGIFGYYPGKAFDDLRISHRRMPSEVSVLAIGNSFYQEGLYRRAADHYRRVAEGDDGPLVAEARYRQGLSLLRAGQAEDAFLLWQGNVDPPWTHWIGYHHLAHAAEVGGYAGIASELPRRYRAAPKDVQRAYQRLWVANVNDMGRADLAEYLDAYLALQDGCFPGAVIANEPGAEALLRRGDYQRIVERYTDDPWSIRHGLFALGRFDEAERRCPDLQTQARVRLLAGRFDELFTDYPQVRWAIREAAFLSGRFDDLPDPEGVDAPAYRAVRSLIEPEALVDGDSRELRVRALVLLDRLEEAAAEWDRDRLTVALPAALLTGRAQAVVDQAGGQAARCGRWQLVLEALRDGREADAAAGIDALTAMPWPRTWRRTWVAEWLVPVARALDAGEVERARELLRAIVDQTGDELARRAWYVAGYALGEVDEATMRSQPAGFQAEALFHLARGLAAELEQADDAGAHYQAYLALPPTRRITNYGERDALAECFVAWRLARAP